MSSPKNSANGPSRIRASALIAALSGDFFLVLQVAPAHLPPGHHQQGSAPLSTMAPIKRKGAAADSSSSNQQKRARVSSEGNTKEQKKQKQGKESKDTERKPTVRQQTSDFSIVRDEEPSFPRGGGSVLTPLERKQIQIQATRDVLFEQKGPNNSTGGLADDDLDEDVDMQDASQGAVTTKKSRKSKNKKRDEKEKSTKDGVRIEGLSFKVRREP